MGPTTGYSGKEPWVAVGFLLWQLQSKCHFYKEALYSVEITEFSTSRNIHEHSEKQSPWPLVYGPLSNASIEEKTEPQVAIFVNLISFALVLFSHGSIFGLLHSHIKEKG